VALANDHDPLLDRWERKRLDRFPSDFMFQLTKDEATALRSQSAISKEGRGGRRYAPYVFTEQGVAMLSGVLEQDGGRRQHRDHAGVR
jgi:hypothetical protein